MELAPAPEKRLASLSAGRGGKKEDNHASVIVVSFPSARAGETERRRKGRRLSRRVNKGGTKKKRDGRRKSESPPFLNV